MFEIQNWIGFCLKVTRFKGNSDVEMEECQDDKNWSRFYKKAGSLNPIFLTPNRPLVHTSFTYPKLNMDGFSVLNGSLGYEDSTQEVQVYKFVKTYRVSNALVPQLRSAVEACNPLSREKRPSSIFTFRSSSFPISCSIGLPWDFVNIQLELQVLFCLHKTLNLAIVMFCTHLCTTTKFYLNYWRYTVSISFLSCFWKFLKFFWFDSQGSYSTFKLDFQVLMHNNARHLHSLKYLSQPSH